MYRFQQTTALLCVAMISSPLLSAQVAPERTPAPIQTTGPTATPPIQKTAEQSDAAWVPLPETPVVRTAGRFSSITRNYMPAVIPPVNLANSNRLDALTRGGNLYLSLEDTIALALENNLDIEVQRISPAIADANILRAKAGGALRGVTPGISGGSGSAASGPTSGQGGQATGITSAASTQAASVSSNTSGALIQQTGSAIPNLDPVIQGIFEYAHNSQPQTSNFVTGTSAFVNDNRIGQAQISKGFLTGTSVNFGYSDSYLRNNSIRNDFNPSHTASLTLNITQHLLQGFGVAVNNRNIRVARNAREGADLQFKQQVIASVANVMDLYWDLVSFNDDVKAKEQALAYNTKLYEDNKKQVEIGTLAPIEIVRAEAAVASSQQDVVVSRTRVLQQETIIKNALSKNGVASPTLASVRIIPTDRIRVPDQEQIQPYQDLVAEALRARPEISAQRINVVNSQINLKGSRSELLPVLDGFVNLGNNALAGSPVQTTTLVNGVPTLVSSANPYFSGGYGTLFGQIFGRNFPNYAAGVQLSIPLRNRAAQADYILDQYTVRQQQLSLQKIENQVRVDVQNAIIGLDQSRVAYQASVKARILQEQTLDAEQKKLNLGASTIFNVILVQRDLAAAQSSEVAALGNYIKARVQMDVATGQVLAKNNISLKEAFEGRVSRAPSPLPPQ